MTNALYVPSGLIVYFVVTGLIYAAAQAKATRCGDMFVYGPTTTIRWLSIVSILGFTCAAIYFSLIPPASQSGGIVFGAIAIAGTWAFPSTLFVDTQGVREVKWWGRTIAIGWKDVGHLEYHKNSSRAVVVSKQGRRIAHTQWQRDTYGFLKLCKQNTGLVAKTSNW